MSRVNADKNSAFMSSPTSEATARIGNIHGRGGRAQAGHAGRRGRLIAGYDSTSSSRWGQENRSRRWGGIRGESIFWSGGRRRRAFRLVGRRWRRRWAWWVEVENRCTEEAK